jgi:hypothetical protein
MFFIFLKPAFGLAQTYKLSFESCETSILLTGTQDSYKVKNQKVRMKCHVDNETAKCFTYVYGKGSETPWSDIVYKVTPNGKHKLIFSDSKSFDNPYSNIEINLQSNTFTALENHILPFAGGITTTKCKGDFEIKK